MRTYQETHNDTLRIVFEMHKSEAHTMTMTTIVSQVVNRISDKLFEEIYPAIKVDALRRLSSEDILDKIQSEVTKRLVEAMLKEKP